MEPVPENSGRAPEAGKNFQGGVLLVLEIFIFVAKQQMNQNHFRMIQYFFIVPERCKGEAVSRGIVQRAEEIVRLLEWVVNQGNGDLDNRQMGCIYDEIY